MARTAHGRTAHQSHTDERILYHGRKSMVFFVFCLFFFFEKLTKNYFSPEQPVFIDGDMVNVALGE